MAAKTASALDRMTAVKMAAHLGLMKVVPMEPCSVAMMVAEKAY